MPGDQNSKPQPTDQDLNRVSDTHDLEPVESRRRSTIDSHWMDELLDLATRAHHPGGLEALAEECVSRIARLLPGCSVGVRVARPARGSWLVQVQADATVEVERSARDGRMFPDAAHERVDRLEEPFGSTLHVASERPNLLESDSPESHVFERAADVVRAVVRGARAEEFANGARREIERLQERIIHGEKLASLGQIVANVVHELNNPLTSIAAYAEHLKRQAAAAPRDEAEVERLSRIGEAAERALGFARDLMDYAKPATETPGPVALGDVVQKALSFCAHEFASSRVEVLCDLGSLPPHVRGIAGHLVQVFVNLFANAAQAMSDTGGELRVRVTERDRLAVVEVEDTGVGIDPARLDRIFEPYYTTRDDDRGTGLGLAIVHDILRAHGGELRVRSTPERGSSFSFTLPLARPAPGRS